MYVYIICQYCNYPRGKDDTLEPLKDRFASNGGIHTTEVEHWVVDGGGAVIKWLYDEAEPCLHTDTCLLYTSPSPRDATLSRMPSSA